MSTSKKCILNINSSILNLDDKGASEGDIERDELSLTGSLLTSDGNVQLSYVEKRDSSETHCQIFASGNFVRVIRRGAAECEMVFEEGKTYKSIYKVPPFSFDMEIKASRVENGIDESGGSISLLYTMTIGGASKRCRMKITVHNM